MHYIDRQLLQLENVSISVINRGTAAWPAFHICFLTITINPFNFVQLSCSTHSIKLAREICLVICIPLKWPHRPTTTWQWNTAWCCIRWCRRHRRFNHLDYPHYFPFYLRCLSGSDINQYNKTKAKCCSHIRCCSQWIHVSQFFFYLFFYLFWIRKDKLQSCRRL